MANYRLRDILYTARLKKRLTLQEVESRAFVSLGTLEALESGRYEYVPAMVYLKGQLKKLAQTYGLDPEKVIALCTQEYDEHIKKKTPVTQAARRLNTDEIPLLETLMRNAPSLAIGGLLLLPIIAFVTFQVRTLLFVPRVALETKDGFEITQVDQFVLRGVVSQGAKLTLNGQSVTIKSEGQFETNLQLNPGYNVLELKAKQRNQESTLLQKVVYLDHNGNQ
jgi:transcriptional regulator with XRE-family HTH domain